MSKNKWLGDSECAAEWLFLSTMSPRNYLINNLVILMTYNESVGRDYIRPVLLSVDSFFVVVVYCQKQKNRKKVCCVAQ